MVGLIGRKIGMTQVFDDSGILTPVTVLKIDDNLVVGERTDERDGYSAHILGAVEMKPDKATKPYRGQFKDGMAPQKHLMEVTDFDVDINVGDRIGVDLFEATSYVDVIGTSKGKGYQGVMKRHGYGGGNKSHGSKFHRQAGSTGMAATPSKVHKGTKMAGRMGGVRSTMQNLRLVQVDKDNQLLLVGGAVPGRRNGIVVVRSAKKK